MSKVFPQIRSQMMQAANDKKVAIEDLEVADEFVSEWEDGFGLHQHPAVIKLEEELAGFSLFLSGLQTMILFAGLLRQHPLLKNTDKQIDQAERLYLGEGEQPVCVSFFHMWELFDLSLGQKEGSFGSLYIELADQFNVPLEVIDIICRSCKSRLGIYHHLGKRGKQIELEDIGTGEVVHVANPGGYTGHKGEIWLARLYPAAADATSFVMATPYIIQGTTPTQWDAFFKKAGVQVRGPKAEGQLQLLMKSPKSPFLWFEYIRDAFVKGGDERHLLLKGLPHLDDRAPAKSKVAAKKTPAKKPAAAKKKVVSKKAAPKKTIAKKAAAKKNAPKKAAKATSLRASRK